MNFGRAIATKARMYLRDSYTDRDHTGKLEDSIQAYSLDVGRSVIVSAYAVTDNNFDYASVVEYGRSANTMPKGKVMVFVGREGRKIYTSHVEGFEGRHYMHDASIWALREIRAYMNRRIKKIIQSGGAVDDESIGITIG